MFCVDANRDLIFSLYDGLLLRISMDGPGAHNVYIYL